MVPFSGRFFPQNKVGKATNLTSFINALFPLTRLPSPPLPPNNIGKVNGFPLPSSFGFVPFPFHSNIFVGGGGRNMPNLRFDVQVVRTQPKKGNCVCCRVASFRVFIVGLQPLDETHPCVHLCPVAAAAATPCVQDRRRPLGARTHEILRPGQHLAEAPGDRTHEVLRLGPTRRGISNDDTLRNLLTTIRGLALAKSCA